MFIRFKDHVDVLSALVHKWIIDGFTTQFSASHILCGPSILPLL